MAGFSVNSSNCYGCKTCQIGCANEKMLPAGVYLRRVRIIDTATGMAYVSMSCNHCDEPACVTNCPVGAYTKDEETGLVIQDHEKCIGCQTCVQKCPFHAPAYNEEESKTYKCDGCIDRQKRGENPVCTIVCPSLNIAYADDFESLLSQETDAKSIKDTVETKPNYGVVMDKDAELDMFANIDGWTETVDRGGENY